MARGKSTYKLQRLLTLTLLVLLSVIRSCVIIFIFETSYESIIFGANFRVRSVNNCFTVSIWAAFSPSIAANWKRFLKKRWITSVSRVSPNRSCQTSCIVRRKWTYYRMNRWYVCKNRRYNCPTCSWRYRTAQSTGGQLVRQAKHKEMPVVP